MATDPEATQDLSDPLVGKILAGRYRLESRIGQGGMGVVYRATHVLLDRPVAVKLMTGALDDMTQKRFAREAKSASRLDHEGCVRVLDFGFEDGTLFLVMELLEGRSLARDLGRALPAARVVDIGRQLALALAHAHEQALVHRDLKPDNVFLVRKGAAESVKVLDFGLARRVEAGSTLTEAGVVFGTPEYMSPEQISGKRVDTPSDIYGLGVLLYHMTTGMLPFQAADFAGILLAHLDERPVPPAERRRDLAIPPALSALILRCLAKDPAMRPTARAVAAELIAPPPTRRSVEEPTVELPAPKPRRMWIVGAVLPVAAAAAAVVWLAMRSPAPRPRDEPGAGPAAPRAAPAPAVTPAPAPAVTAPPAAPPSPQAGPAAEHLREASRHRREGNAIKELYHLQQAVREEPKNPVALYQLGAALIASDQGTLGCETLARAGTYAPAVALRRRACER